jgi:hypothetical protein
MHHIESIGSGTLLQQLQALQKLRGDRFTPDPGWDSLFNAAEEETA